MSFFIFKLTLRQIAGRKASLIPVGLGLLPLLIAAIFRLSGEDIDPERWTANALYVGMMLTVVLPLTALLIGTSVLGDELEDGTALYLLTKPIPRWKILLPKLLAAMFVTCTVAFASTIAAGWLALHNQGDMAIVRGFGAAVLLGGIAYTALFVMLSLATNRALITGLIYVFVWEATITQLFSGVRYISIRFYTLGIARDLSDPPARVLSSQLDGTLALVLMLVATVVAIVYANLRLQQIEVRETA